MTEPALRAALAAGTSATVTAWHDEIGGRELISRKPQPGKVTARREIAEIGVTVLTLSNGVEVWLKPTDFRNDQIVFSSVRQGRAVARCACRLPERITGHVTGRDCRRRRVHADRFGKLLAGRLGGASAYVSSYSQGVNGSGTPKDLETALQLTYLHFTAPNANAEAFELMKQRLEASLANQVQSPGAVYGERVRRINTLDHYSARALRLEDLSRLDPEKMIAFYKQIFANAANFTFFFVGTFTVDGVTPLSSSISARCRRRGHPMQARATCGSNFRARSCARR